MTLQSSSSSAKDIDEIERRLARIDPLFIIIYNSVLISYIDVLGAFAPQIYRVSNLALALGRIVVVTASTICLNSMSKVGAVLLSILNILLTLFALFPPLYLAFVLWVEQDEAYWNQHSITLDPYSFGGSALPPVLFSPVNVSLALCFFLGLYIYFTISRGWITIARLSTDQRFLLRSHHLLYPNRMVAWLRYLGIPPIATFLKSKRWLVLPLLVVSALLIGLGIKGLIEQLSTGYVASVSAADLQCQHQLHAHTTAQIVLCRQGLLNQSYWEFYVDFGVIVFAIVAGDFVLRIARNQMRMSVDALLASDERAPILFLRSFRDDQVKLSPSTYRTWLGRLLALCQPAQPFDHLLLDEGTTRGPVVALGSPGERFPPYGIARGYFEHKDWKQGVEQLASASQAIVICLDDTEGISWETNHISRQRLYAKTLFLFHPRASDPQHHAIIVDRLKANFSSDNSEFDDLWEKLQRQYPLGGVIGFFIDNNGTWQLAKNRTFSAYAYLLTLRWFMRTKFGLKANPNLSSSSRSDTTEATPKGAVT
jgi:hypothetical protein